MSYLHRIPGEGIGSKIHDHLTYGPDIPNVVEDYGVVTGCRAQQVGLHLVELDMMDGVYTPLESSKIGMTLF